MTDILHTRTQDLRLRFATADDVGLILHFIRGLAEYERLTHEVVADEASLRASLFGERRVAEVIIAELAGAPAGFALFFHSFSTFVDDRDIWQSSMRHIAYEGRLFLVSACQHLPPPAGGRAGDQPWPPGQPLIRGGSVIVSPMGEVLAGPLYGEEGLVTATVDLSDIVRGRYDLDPVGHYARPDIFRLEVDTEARPAAAWTPAEGAPTPPRHVLTILAVEDLSRARHFYQEAFGWPARVEVPVYVELALPDGRGLGLYRRENFAHNTGQAPQALPAGAIAGTEIYLRCDDLHAAVSRALGAGARLLSAAAPREWGDDAAYLADPDGNVVVLAVPSA